MQKQHYFDQPYVTLGEPREIWYLMFELLPKLYLVKNKGENIGTTAVS